MFFFFFQAEDGIRDYKVTGVQTCALPIFARFARGDWGRSIATGRPVRALLGEAVPATVELVGLSLVLDRKSTRLNSSHLVISYAVFCLKKKQHLPRLRLRSAVRDRRLVRH